MADGEMASKLEQAMNFREQHRRGGEPHCSRTLCLAHTGLWSLVFGLWPVACGLWPVVCGLWSVICGLWPVVFGLWSLVFGLWPVLRTLVCGLPCAHWSVVCGLS